MSLIVNLKSRRLEQKISQIEFAKLCGVSRQTIHATETAKYTPSVELALRMADVLRLSVDDLFILNNE